PPHNGGFGNRRMTDKRTLDFHRSNPMAGHIDHVIKAPHDAEITIFVAPCAVAREIHAWNLTPVLHLVPFGIAVNSAEHRRPRLLHYKEAALIGADRISLAIDHIRDDARQWPRRRSRLCWNGSGNRRDHDG